MMFGAQNGIACANCNDTFECKPHDITNCHCNQVVLSAEQLQLIAQNFNGCLCHACLQLVKTNQLIGK